MLLVREMRESDAADVLAIVNRAAEAYRGVIPADCWHEPGKLNAVNVEVRFELAVVNGHGIRLEGLDERLVRERRPANLPAVPPQNSTGFSDIVSQADAERCLADVLLPREQDK